MEIIKSVDFYMSEDYIQGVYNSCAGVIVPSTGGFAMDMACGFHDSKTCNAKRWVRFLLIYANCSGKLFRRRV